MFSRLSTETAFLSLGSRCTSPVGIERRLAERYSAGARRRQCFSVTLKTESTDEGGFAKYPYSYPFLCLFEVGPGWNEVDGMEKMRRRRRKRRRRRRTRRRWMMMRRRMLWKSCMKESSESVEEPFQRKRHRSTKR